MKIQTTAVYSSTGSAVAHIQNLVKVHTANESNGEESQQADLLPEIHELAQFLGSWKD